MTVGKIAKEVGILKKEANHLITLEIAKYCKRHSLRAWISSNNGVWCINLNPANNPFRHIPIPLRIQKMIDVYYNTFKDYPHFGSYICDRGEWV